MVKYTLWGTEVNLDIPETNFPTESDRKEIDDLLAPDLTHGFIRSTTGEMLHYRKYLPEGRLPKAICVWHHGMQAHSGVATKPPSTGRITNYALISREIVKAGYALYTLDMLGHGFSEGSRFYVPSWKTSRNNLESFARFAASEYPDRTTPLFLGGESFGACLAIHVGRAWQNAAAAKAAGGNTLASEELPPAGFRGLCLIAPAIVGDLPPKPVVFLLRYVLRPLRPKWKPFFMPNPVNPEQIWSDPEVRSIRTSSKYKDMRLEASGEPFSLGTASELLSGMEAVREESIPGLNVAFFVCHGTEDGGVPIEGTEYLVAHSCKGRNDGKNEKVFRRVKGAKHDLWAEPSAQETMAFMLSWMKDRVDGNPTLAVWK